MKPLKTYFKNKAIIVGGGILLLLALAVLLTHTIASWSADASQSENIRIQNLLTMQKDSLEGIYVQQRITALDSAEKAILKTVYPLSEENDKLKQKLSEKDKTINDLKEKFKTDPTLENCSKLVEKQSVKIEEQVTLITGLEKEAQQWCELYENENAKGIEKDTLLAQKNRTLKTVNAELKTVNGELQTVNNKINKTSWFKRNWLWSTNSYRNWLKSR